MDNKIYLIAAIQFASVIASDDIDPTKYRGGVMGNYLYQASKNLVVVVSEVKTGLPEVANKSGAEFLKGALEQLPADKRREIGSDLAHGFIEKINTKEGHEAVYKLGENLIKGAAGGVVIVAGMAKDAVIAKTVSTAVAAKAATIAGATVAAPYVAVGAVTGGAFYGLYKMEDTINKHEEAFKTCLNTNLGCKDLNSRGFPSRCESPERKMSWWTHGRSEKPIASFKDKRKKEGL